MTQLELAALPLAERLQMMEDLWTSLSMDAGAVPDWHEDVLKARAQSLDEGTETVSDWADAKTRLRQRAASA